MDSLWSHGGFLGYRAASGEVIYGTAASVFRTRALKRNALEHRCQKNLLFVGGVLWRTSPEQDEAEDTMPVVDFEMRMPEVDLRSPDLDVRELVPRRLYIRAKEITKFAATVDCKACVATMRGAGGVPIQIRAESGLLRRSPEEMKAIECDAHVNESWSST